MLFSKSQATLKALIETRRAVLFDFYNTLVLDQSLPIPVWQHLNQLGYRCSPVLEAMFEPNAFDGSTTPRASDTPDHESWRRGNWRRLLVLSGVPTEDLDQVLSVVLSAQASFSSRPAAGATELIRALKCDGYRIGLCSNWETPIEPFLARDGIDVAAFDAITTSAEIGARKPHGLMFLRTCEKLEVSPDEAIHVGDSWIADVAGALRAGLGAAWLRLGRPSMDLEHLVPEFESLADLHRAYLISRAGA